MRPLRLLFIVFGLAACSDDVPLDLSVGPVGFDVDASRITLPATLQSSGTVARVPCSSALPCPNLGAGAPTLQCVASACDPGPFAFDLGVMNAIDLSAYSSVVATLSDNVRQITITQMSWQAAAMGLRVPVGPVEVYWGPESASGIASDGVRRLGRIPTLAFSAAGTASGNVELDAAGNAALSTHFLHTSRRFRLFARATVDLAPGGPLPAGRASIQVRMNVRVETRVLP